MCMDYVRLCVCVMHSRTPNSSTALVSNFKEEASAGFLPHAAELLLRPLTNQHDKSQLQVFF